MKGLNKLLKERNEIKKKKLAGKKLTDWEKTKLRFNAVIK